MNKHIEYYEGNDQISSGFEFIEKLVDAWFFLMLWLRI